MGLYAKPSLRESLSVLVLNADRAVVFNAESLPPHNTKRHNRGNVMIMMVEYLRVVHQISIDIAHQDWQQHLKYYVARIGDSILHDAWEKHVRRKNKIYQLRKNRIKRYMEFKKKKACFYVLNSPPKRWDFIERYRYSKVALSWF